MVKNNWYIKQCLIINESQCEERSSSFAEQLEVFMFFISFCMNAVTTLIFYHLAVNKLLSWAESYTLYSQNKRLLKLTMFAMKKYWHWKFTTVSYQFSEGFVSLEGGVLSLENPDLEKRTEPFSMLFGSPSWIFKQYNPSHNQPK